MREFQTEWKVNFVDKNNVLVGFDTSQNCCENFGWYLTKTPRFDVIDSYWKPEVKPDPSPPDLEQYVFDTSFFQRKPQPEDSYGGEDDAVLFRLTNGDQELFLVLYNSHNGYYSHGFYMEVGGKNLNEGSI